MKKVLYVCTLIILGIVFILNTAALLVSTGLVPMQFDWENILNVAIDHHSIWIFSIGLTMLLRPIIYKVIFKSQKSFNYINAISFVVLGAIYIAFSINVKSQKTQLLKKIVAQRETLRKTLDEYNDTYNNSYISTYKSSKDKGYYTGTTYDGLYSGTTRSSLNNSSYKNTYKNKYNSTNIKNTDSDTYKNNGNNNAENIFCEEDIEQIRLYYINYSKELNAQLPLKIDELTTLTSVVFANWTFTYSYTLDVDINDLEESNIKTFLNEIKALQKEQISNMYKAYDISRDIFVKLCKHTGLKYRYIYYDANDILIGSNVFNYKDF